MCFLMMFEVRQNMFSNLLIIIIIRYQEVTRIWGIWYQNIKKYSNKHINHFNIFLLLRSYSVSIYICPFCFFMFVSMFTVLYPTTSSSHLFNNFTALCLKRYINLTMFIGWLFKHFYRLILIRWYILYIIEKIGLILEMMKLSNILKMSTKFGYWLL